MKKSTLRKLIKESITEVINEIGIDQLHSNWVDSGKLSEEDFQEIVAISPKSSYITWIIPRVVGTKKVIKSINQEDVYKWKEYLSIFEKYKHLFPSKDINSYKLPIHVSKLMAKAIEIRDQQFQGEEGKGGDDLLNPTQIKNLKEVGINLLGMVDGYQCFKVPQNARGNDGAYKRYKNILGQCSGGGIDICTIANQNYFNDYLTDDDYYVFFNKKDPQSPYQFHYASSEFKDRNNIGLI